MKIFAWLTSAAIALASFVGVSSAEAAPIPRNPDYPNVVPFCWGAGAAAFDCVDNGKVTFSASEYPIAPPRSLTCDSRVILDINDCIIGAPYSDLKIAVVGSSHGRLMWGAYDIIGDLADVSVHVFFRNSCHFMVTTVTDCARRNLAIKPRLLAGEFDLVIFAQRVDLNLPGEETVTSANYTTYYQELKRANIPFVVIKDNPHITKKALKCFKSKKNRKNPNKCAVPRSVGFRNTDFAVQAATALNVPVLDFSDFYCTATTCLVARGGMPIYTDETHVTAVWGRSLGPFMWSELERLGLLDFAD